MGLFDCRTRAMLCAAVPGRSLRWLHGHPCYIKEIRNSARLPTQLHTTYYAGLESLVALELQLIQSCYADTALLRGS
jgi:hypothetical protein